MWEVVKGMNEVNTPWPKEEQEVFDTNSCHFVHELSINSLSQETNLSKFINNTSIVEERATHSPWMIFSRSQKLDWPQTKFVKFKTKVVNSVYLS